MKGLFLCFFLFFLSCSLEKEDETDVIARVNDHVLTIKKLENLLPPGNRTDNQIKKFVYSWVENILLYDAAVKSGLKEDLGLLAMRDLFYRKLLGSTFIRTQTQGNTTITDNDVRKYYQENKLSFSRSIENAVIRSFVASSMEEARKIKKTLSNPRTTKKKAELFNKYTVETKTVKKGHMTKNLDLAVFSGKENNLLGPIISDNYYYIVEILRLNRVGTIKGLEEVYDEIYQRLLKENEGVLFQVVLDSLYAASTVFITSNIRDQQ